MSTYKLTYFNLKGLAEPIRVLFALAGVSFEDVRFSLDLTNFSRPEFDAARAANELTINMDRVPILEVDGVKIGQSATIQRFVARKFGFFGADELEAARIDMITEHVRDIRQKYYEARAGKKDAELEAAKAAFVETELPKWAAKLEKVVDAGGFAVGGKLSLADVQVRQLVEDSFDDKEATAKAFADCPNLLASAASVSAAAKTYFETRPVTPF